MSYMWKYNFSHVHTLIFILFSNDFMVWTLTNLALLGHIKISFPHNDFIEMRAVSTCTFSFVISVSSLESVHIYFRVNIEYDRCHDGFI